MSNNTTQTLAPSRRPARRQAPWAAVWRDVIGAWRLALVRRHDVLLDDEALRDLGLCRSELQAFLAEVESQAEVTRMRVVHHRASMML